MKKLLLKIKGLFILAFGGTKKFNDFLTDHSEDAVQFVEQIKDFVKSKTVITLISIFPKYQAKAQHFLDEAEKFLDELLNRLNLGQECLAMPVTVERVKCLVEVIRGKSKAEQAKIYQDMSINYLQIKSREYTADGSEISASQARTISEIGYQAMLADKAGIAEVADIED